MKNKVDSQNNSNTNNKVNQANTFNPELFKDILDFKTEKMVLGDIAGSLGRGFNLAFLPLQIINMFNTIAKEYQKQLNNLSIIEERGLMQNHLQQLRKIAGWSTTELGAKLGMTRQAINALENKQNNINQVHYLALLFLFISESINNNNIALATIINLLFNNTISYNSKKDEYDNWIEEIANDKSLCSIDELNKRFKELVITQKDKEKIGFSALMSRKPLTLGKIIK